MSFLGSLFKKSQPEMVIGSPVSGKCVSVKEVNDPTFAEEIIGKGVAVIPSDGRVCAPADGEIMSVFPTGHAVALTTADGAEVLIHIGLDTVTMNGEGFDVKVKAGDKVKKGDLLVEFDLAKVKEKGFDPITPVLVCNGDAFASVEGKTGMQVQAGDTVIVLGK